MEFYLNGDKHVLEPLDPAMTLLRYLRTVVKLKGTKEGCASGDCGACTVLVAKQGQWQSVNSCIALVGSFANQEIYTVDGLANQETGELHPVQKAMVDCHGSQCGFCTPGFVMSLAGLYGNNQEGTEIPRQQIFDAISGNLCRCTGYQPIINAAEQMLSYEPTTPINTAKSETNRLVHYFDAGSPDDNGSAKGEASVKSEYYLPKTERDLQCLLANGADPFLVAGGTDKVLEISQNYASPKLVIDLSQLDSLRSIEVTESHLDIGGAASYTEIEPIIAQYSPNFLEILHRLGSRQIRNRGTLGGNIANGSPIADTPPILFVWEAQLELVNSRGERTWVAIKDFYTGYRQTLLGKDQYIAKIRISTEEINRPHCFYKISKRFEDDISALLGAFVVEQDKGQCSLIRIAFGGMAATPVRASKTEQFLLGKELNQHTLDKACELLSQEFTPLSDVRASAEYRREMAANLLRKALSELQGLKIQLDPSQVVQSPSTEAVSDA